MPRPKVVATSAVSCQNEYIRAMLVPYAERSLAKSNRAEVEAHVAECSSCRDELRRLQEVMRPLSELAKDGFKPVYDAHPSHEQLFNYSVKNPEQSKEERRGIHLHVLMCQSCQGELDLIAQVEHDFSNLSAGDSAKWIMPPVLRNLFSHSKTRHSGVSEVKHAENIPWRDRLSALMQKINLRLGVVIVAILVTIFCCLYLVMCGGGDEEAENGNSKAQVTAENGKSADRIGSNPGQKGSGAAPPGSKEAAKNLRKVNSWSPVAIGTLELSKACELLDRLRIPYVLADDSLEVSSDDLERANAELKREQEGRSSDSSGMGQNSAVAEDSAGQNDYREAQPQEGEASYNLGGENSADNNYAAETYGEAYPEQAEVSYSGQSGSSYEQPITSYQGGGGDSAEVSRPADTVSPKAEDAVRKPEEDKPVNVNKRQVPIFSQPRVAIPAKKRSNRPARTYIAPSYQETAKSATSTENTNTVSTGVAPAPISATYLSGNTYNDSKPKDMTPPSPAVIRPEAGEDIIHTWRTETRPAVASDDGQEVPVADNAAGAEGEADDGQAVVGGNTYNDSDSIVNREVIE